MYCCQNILVLTEAHNSLIDCYVEPVHPVDTLIFLTTPQMRSKKLPRRLPKHYYNPPGMSIWRNRHLFENEIAPNLLLYGDSHLANLRKWALFKEEDGGPRPLDEAMLLQCKHCSVGGSTFANIYMRSRNINVPPTQPNRGNQWQEVLDEPNFDPAYIFLSLGSNDCDTFGRRLAWMSQQQLLACAYPDIYGTDMIRFDPNAFFEQELDKFVSQIDRVISRLEKHFPDAEVVFSSVFERSYWDDMTTLMAKCINWYIKCYRGCRTVNLNGKVPLTLLKRDKIHYKNLGYRVFMDKGLGMLLEFYNRHQRH